MTEMLQHTFLHLPTLGPIRERQLWAQGIQTWDDLFTRGALLLPAGEWSHVKESLEISRERLAAGDYRYFLRVLPPEQHWRVISERTLDRIAYLDIETTGMGCPPAARSTTITFYYKGKVLQAYHEAEKLELIRTTVDDCLILSTFFGQGFDLPFLSQEFGFQFQVPHIDLCFWLKRHGYRGGLKKVQTQFPEIPQRESEGMDGMDAVRLWQQHLRGRRGALETLLHYNAEDTIVLEPLLINAFNLETQQLAELGFPPLSRRPLPRLQTQIHID